MRPAHLAHASASAAAAGRRLRPLQAACMLGLAGCAIAGHAQDAGSAPAEPPPLASIAAGTGGDAEGPPTTGALAAAWRQGGVPLTAPRGPAPDLARIDTTTTVQRPVPGTALQAGDRAEITGLGYRWWTSRGATDIGFGLGSVGYVVRPYGGMSSEAPMLASTATSVSVGVRYHANERSVVYADASAAPGFDRGDAYFTKVGIEWKAASSPLSLVHGGIGFQLDNTSRMTFRVRRGGLGVYLRSEF